MEQQKIMWIILSVAFFLTAVTVGAIVLLKPPETASTTTANSAAGAPEDNTSNPDEAAAADITPSDIINNGELPDLPSEMSEEESFTFSGDDPAYTNGVINIDDVNVAIDNAIIVTTEEYYERRGEKIQLSDKKTAPPPAASSSGNSSSSSGSNSTSSNSFSSSGSSTASNTSSPKSEPKLVKDYWIQVAAYTKKSQAESEQQYLTEKSFPTSIFTKELNGQTYYRLRHGPFTSIDEADKFLGWIQSKKGYEDSFMDVVYVFR